MDFTIMFAGEAGQGVATIGVVLATTRAGGGYHIFAPQDYESRIRGGHNFFQVRIADRPIYARQEQLGLLVALNQDSIDRHGGEIAPEGGIVYDGERIKREGPSLLPTPLEKLALEKGGSRLTSNAVALGAALGLIQHPLEPLAGILRERFKGEEAEGNVRAAQAGYEHARAHFPGRLSPIPTVPGTQRLLLNGNEAIALGALAAGCRFVAGYPMSPSTPILEFLAGRAQEFGLVALQAEDEIAVMNMALGASFAGARSLPATSGGGFCLMVEGLGLAGMTETPIVIVEGQRPGPSTGLPTRTEQADLEFVLHASHGEFPRAVLAPGTAEEAFYAMAKAFNLAEKYQTPVIVMSDQHLADSYWTIDTLDVSRITIDRGQLIRPEEAEKLAGYKRHAITHSGISPRALPGYPGITVVTDSDEHDEEGHLTEDTGLRTRMMLKRMRKEIGLAQEISPPKFYGTANPEVLLIGWGSTYGAIREAVDILQSQGQKVGMMHLSEIWPFPSGAVARALESARACFVVENNATGQLARLIRRETGKAVTGKILKFDGLPFSPE